MIKNILFILIALSTISTKAQEELVFSTDEISRLYKLDNILYYSVQNIGINFIDLNDPNFIPQILTSSINNPLGMEYYNGHLYTADFDTNKVFKLDLSQTNPSPIDVFEIDVPPNDLLFLNDVLYFSANTVDVIASYDINSGATLPDVEFNVLGAPIGLEYKDGFIYVASPIGDAIYRKDLNDENSELELVIDDNTAPDMDHPVNIEFIGNNLYIANLFSDNILKVDISSPPFVAQEILSLNGVKDLLFDNNYLYYCNGAFIYRIELSSLNIDEFAIQKPKLYPNPVVDILHVSNIKSSQLYEIYDVTGRKIKHGILNMNDNSINVNTLNSGIYYLKFIENNISQKFTKR